MKKVKLIVVLMLMMGFLFPQPSFAKDTKKVGNVLGISGDVDIKKGGGNKLFKAFKNMAFTQGDTIITGGNGKAKLSLDADKEVSVAANTKLVISELVSSVKAQSGKTNLTLVSGKVKVKVNKKLEGESRFSIQTPDAIMGVMGTEFYVYYDEQGTWVGVLEGEVTVGIGGNEPIQVGANKSLFIDEEGNFEIVELDVEQALRFEERRNNTLFTRLKTLFIAFDSIGSGPDELSDSTIPEVPVDSVDLSSESVDLVNPVDPPSVQTPTLVSVEKYNANPELREQLTIVYEAHGDTLTNVFVGNDQDIMDEVEGIHYEILDDKITFGQEFLQNMLRTDIDSTEIRLEFVSGATLLVTLERMEVDPIVPDDPPSAQTPTLVLAEKYNADPELREQLTIVYEAHGDTLTNVFVGNDQDLMDEVEGIHYEILDDKITFGQEFLQNMLRTNIDSTEINLEFVSGFILSVTLMQE